MGRFFQLSRCFAVVSLAAVSVASASPSAHIRVVPGCDAADKLSNGGWRIRSTRTFGRAGEVEGGAVIWTVTVLNGFDIGAFLDKTCFRRYNIEPDCANYAWPPNGYPTLVTPIP